MQAALRSLSSLVLLLIVLAGLSFVPVSGVHAQATPDELKAQMEESNRKIKALDAEIAQYQSQLNSLGGEHKSLQSAIDALNVTRSKTLTELSRTQAKISSSNLKLKELSYEISDKEDVIRLDRAALAKSLREVASADDNTLIEYVLASDSLTEAWTAADSLATLNAALQDHADELAGVKRDLEGQHQQVSATKANLTDLSNDLANQKKQVEVQKSEKDKLLSQTKSQEASYQALITQKRAEQKAFEAELFRLSEQLTTPVNTGAIPTAAKGILRWPLDTVNITQLFGATVDSVRLYASGTHDGIDLGIPTGTPVHAALSGTVQAINEGAVQNCQYGKWVLVRHANGLTTLYAHLSQISVAAGQSVTTGQTLGFSGMTGYATGPHLHFTVYSSSAVTLKQYTCKSGPTVTIPIAPPAGYLNPMAYL